MRMGRFYLQPRGKGQVREALASSSKAMPPKHKYHQYSSVSNAGAHTLLPVCGVSRDKPPVLCLINAGMLTPSWSFVWNLVIERTLPQLSKNVYCKDRWNLQAETCRVLSLGSFKLIWLHSQSGSRPRPKVMVRVHLCSFTTPIVK